MGGEARLSGMTGLGSVIEATWLAPVPNLCPNGEKSLTDVGSRLARQATETGTAQGDVDSRSFGQGHSGCAQTVQVTA